MKALGRRGSPIAGARESSLVRAIGVLGLAAGIVNLTIGGGIFRLPADVARQLGAAAPLAYAVCLVAMALIVVCFAEAGSRVDLTGGPYAYVETAFGPFVGFLTGVTFWVQCSLVTAAVSVIFALNVTQLVPAVAGRTGSALLLIGLFLVLSSLHIAGVERGTAFNTVATAAKMLPLLLLLMVGPFFVTPANLAWTDTPAASAVSRTSILLVFAFAGIEMALIPSGEVKDVRRTVPLAILIGMTTVAVMYIGLQIVAQGVLGPALATSNTPLAEVGGRIFGRPGRAFLLAGAAVSTLATLSGHVLAVPRALFALSRDGFLPRALASVHPARRTPHVAIAVQSTIACALALTNTFERLAILATATTLCLYGLCCLAAWELRRRDVQAQGPPLRLPGAALAPPLACAAIAWMLTSVTAAEWAGLVAVLVIATLVFFATARSRARRVAAA
jgi:APA family basic amino acid/polyamine antiporter